jgi:hypothetical protein
LHASHWAPQATLQHTPSTQKPLVHALAFVHEIPSTCFFAQTPPLQYASVAQSVSRVQLGVHDPFTQSAGSQSTPVTLLTHVPAPLHV